MKRLFCAVKVAETEEIRRVFEAYRQSLSDASIKWVSIHNLHITLRFLGDTPTGMLAPITEALHHVAADHPPFRFRIQGCGTFGSAGQARVIWLGIKNAKPLIALTEKVNAQLTSMGYKPAHKLFNPHLTIGRIKHIDEPHRIASLESEYSETHFGEYDTTSFHLIESFLKPQGPLYKVLHTFELGEGHRA